MPSAGRLGDSAHVPADSHGCPACPHSAVGPATAGSLDVFINEKPALRVGDTGVHAACCGSNTWVAVGGAASVLINGRKAHRQGDSTAHCGGSGSLVEGSPNVIIGDETWSSVASSKLLPIETTWTEVELLREDGTPAAHEKYRLVLSDGSCREGELDEKGFVRIEGIPRGSYQVLFPEMADEWDTI